MEGGFTAEQDLLDAVKDTLEKNGHLGRIKGELRTAVLNILHHGDDPEKPDVPEETKVINEMVREFLLWNGYKYSEQVLVAETGMHKERPNRDYMANRLGVQDDDKTGKVPLLYYVVEFFQGRNTQARNDDVSGCVQCNNE